MWHLNLIDMKRGKLVILMICMVIFGLTNAFAQSKKEKIEGLTKKVDSLEKALSVKNESLVQTQIKLAKLEGTRDTHNEEIKRLEDKADSLKEALITKNMTVESQASKIAQLNADISGLQAQQKEWTSKNDTLTSQLNSLKPKPSDIPATTTTIKDPVKDVKSPGVLKEEGKAGNTTTGKKQDPIVKN
jgi:chromosome segregation ATPase